MPDTDSRTPDRNTAYQVIEPDAGGTNLLPVFLLRFDRKQTRRAYRNDIVQFFGTDYITPGIVRAATSVHVNAHLELMERDGQKPTTLQRRLAAIRGFYNWLVALKLVDSNPADRQLVRKIRSVNVSDRHVIVLSIEHVKRLLEATVQAGKAAVRDYTLIQVLLHCVLRRSEAAEMTVEHIKQVGPYWVIDLPRTKGGANQYVKAPDHVVEHLNIHRATYGISNGALWRSMSQNSSSGRPLSAAGIYEIVKRTARRAGLADEISAHTLRHTGCTLAIEAGASIQQVQSHARHKSLQTTLVYVHQRDRLRDSAADYIKV